ncbi:MULTISPECIES: response regulator [Pacificibacter]|uniref:response regulator n=1 Tax=Pacificibacter TaxID=1042323 RepID=UPI001C08D7A5|nr:MULTISPECIES: response regulator [Pacificibacter]MBU2937535.1 response regulator [Pacificibacter marinus]MDO6616666.1 response regulator [Pacificibacter sp. 1_MG-2023]
MSLLVVDDDPNILELMAAILTSQGYEDVVYAQSGEEALSLIHQGQYHFSTFILDIQMPGMDGVDLCGRIRSVNEHRRTPIIMLTAMRDKEHIDAAFLRGATDYITKPIDTTDLCARINVAQLLFNEQQSVMHATRREENLRLNMSNKSNADADFDLADAVTIFDVPRVLGSLEMENYLHRLSRGKRFMCGAICFQIQKRERLFSMTSPLEFHGILTDVAEAIFETLRSYNVMISYVGNGQYVAILPRTLQLDEAELELKLSLMLSEFGLIGGDTVPLDVTVKVGEAVRMSMFDSSPAALIARAISKAELKSTLPHSVPMFDVKRTSMRS